MNYKIIYIIEPPYSIFYKNEFFNSNSNKDRDNSLEPINRLYNKLTKKGFKVITADQFDPSLKNVIYYYYGFDSYKIAIKHFGKKNFIFKNFMIYEPQLINQRNYRNLDLIVKQFEKVYVHDVIGIKNLVKSKYKKKIFQLYWSQHNVKFPIKPIKMRKNKIILINGHHNPYKYLIYNLNYKSFFTELYSKRIKLIKFFAKKNYIDLFGVGWGRFFSLDNIWLNYIFNYPYIKKVYIGEVKNKNKILQKYKFSICIENEMINNYHTEKLFDVIRAGTIPIYLTSNSCINELDKKIFIDINDFESLEDLYNYINSLTDNDLKKIQSYGQNFLKSKKYKKFTHFFEQTMT